MIVCGIETSCDETSVAIYNSQKKIFFSVISSQADIHNRFGGVVPEIASRNHALNILPVFEKCLMKAGLEVHNIDLIGVTKSPGLIGALFVGISFAKGLSLGLNRPLIGVNHLFAHILSAEIDNDITPPYLGVVLSGGHTHIYGVDECYNVRLYSKTLDDAVGESFDKIAKFAGLPYPGGPEIEKLALKGDENRVKLPIALKNEPNFSFSGLKTHVINLIEAKTFSLEDIAASFQRVVCDTVALKVNYVLSLTGLKKVVVSGGVACNNYLREHLPLLINGKVFFPSKRLCTDNGDMIAYAAYKIFRKRDFLGFRETAKDNDDLMI
ncbi:MAG: tRNA (adenosine(37)-N6)-threonylcarbamoyltransferase complex transferase subunit TsaD [Calditerrivibrio sp.]|nr:tRNA (adenosine(37)-N6)-threonylcarbamoyltransferase complex transferase subunit TsaD [Calditerrivibrio sp.]